MRRRMSFQPFRARRKPARREDLDSPGTSARSAETKDAKSREGGGLPRCRRRTRESRRTRSRTLSPRAENSASARVASTATNSMSLPYERHFENKYGDRLRKAPPSASFETRIPSGSGETGDFDAVAPFFAFSSAVRASSTPPRYIDADRKGRVLDERDAVRTKKRVGAFVLHRCEISIASASFCRGSARSRSSP